MPEIREQVKNAIDNVADRAKSATDWMADKSEVAAESLKGTSRQTAQRMKDSAERAKEKVGAWVNDATGPVAQMCSEAACETQASVRQFTNDLTDIVRRYPLMAVAVGFGMGLLIGRTSGNRT